MIALSRLKVLVALVNRRYRCSLRVRLLAVVLLALVLTDLSMGDGIDGWELAAAIDATTPDVPVILVTGWGAAIDQAETR